MQDGEWVARFYPSEDKLVHPRDNGATAQHRRTPSSGGRRWRMRATREYGWSPLDTAGRLVLVSELRGCLASHRYLECPRHDAVHHPCIWNVLKADIGSSSSKLLCCAAWSVCRSACCVYNQHRWTNLGVPLAHCPPYSIVRVTCPAFQTALSRQCIGNQ